jgi:hypothetical protein
MVMSNVLTTARPAVFQDSGAGLRISALALDERKCKGYDFFDSMFHSLLLPRIAGLCRSAYYPKTRSNRHAARR